MSISRIEKIVSGTVTHTVERSKRSGNYVCLSVGSNMIKSEFADLEQVADYLRSNPGSGVRMNPGWSKIVNNIHIDGTAL
jgi:hypothetical protein